MNMIHSSTLAAGPISLLFSARSIAIIGASADPGKLSSWPLNTLVKLGYTGDVHVVNPNRPSVLGYSCVASIAALPDSVEAAMIMLPADAAIAAAEECGQKGVKALVIAAQGFGESASGIDERSRRLFEIAKKYDMAIAGPNTNGLMDLHSRLAFSFSPLIQMSGSIRSGSVGLLSQSGNMVSYITEKLTSRGLGISKAITTGNELVLSLGDYLDLLANDPDTRTIVLFLETIRDIGKVDKALTACRRAGKRVIALKVGESERAQQVALSHTGAIAGSYRNTLAYLERQGVIVVDDLDSMATAAELLDRNRWSTGDNGQTCVISISGGMAGLVADEAARHALQLASPSKDAESALFDLSSQCQPNNPYDIAGNNAILPAVAQVFGNDGFRNLIFVLGILVDPIRKSVIEKLIEIKQAGFERIFVVSSYVDADDRAALWANGISISDNYIPLIKSLRAILVSRSTSDTPAPRILSELDGVLGRSTAGLLDEGTSKRVLTQLGVRVPRSTVVHTPEESRSVDMGMPIVAKGLTDRIAHKSDHGLVALSLETPEDLETACQQIFVQLETLDPESPGILVEEMVIGGVEAFVGIERDPVVGPVVVAGAGGTLVELLDDVILLSAPFQRTDVIAALERTRFSRLLSGYRGQRFDIEAFVDVIMRVGGTAAQDPRFVALDINPLFIQPNDGGAIAADAKVVLA